METCKGPECNRPVKLLVHGLCSAHYQQLRKHGEMWVLGTRHNGGHNKKYFEGTACDVEGCDIKPHANNKCMTHDWQFRKHGKTWEIGKRMEGRKMNHNSIEHTCNTCKEKKSWRSFVMGVDSPYYECRDCYRKRLLAPPKDDRKKPRFTMTDMMAYLDTQTK